MDLLNYVGGPCDPDNLTQYATPWGLRVTVNKAILPRFRAACEEAAGHPWKPKRIDSYNCRQIRGSTSWSRHAYACAFDMFDKPYPEPVDVWGNGNSPPPSFAEIFERYGFTWGGRWTGRPDYPHIEWSDSTVPDYEEKDWFDMATEADLKKIVKEAVDDATKDIKAELVRQRKLLAVGEERAYEPAKVNIKSAIPD